MGGSSQAPDRQVERSRVSLGLDPAEREEALRACEELIAACPAAPDPALLGAAAVHAQGLPRRLRELLAAVRRQDDWGCLQIGCGALVPQDTLGDTPTGVEAPNDGLTPPEALLLLIAALLGDVFGWRTQQGGRLIHDIVPIAGFEQGQTSSSSARELSLHTEDAFHPYRADYVGLCCMRNREAAGTTVSDIEDVELDAEARRILFEPRFRFIADESHHVANGRPGDDLAMGAARVAREARPASVLFGAPEQPRLRLDPDYTVAVEGDVEAQQVLDRLCLALLEAKTEVVSEAGDYLVLNNQRIVHGRAPFRARYDGRQRWFKRVNVTRDLAKMADAGATFANPIVR